ncbi:DUF1192 domain-containing protein [Sphingomonas arenae]|uniref:DUF1192 domain-containing protein n=1 Tax=Sphingomonas arenae TaxID=2812555 RepID=UPI0019686B51|nr:DUF1192 domain-containing protein [Sphingomonas arenae]
MDDDFAPSKPDDPLTLLAKQDLDPMSHHELEARIEALKAEIVRTETHMTAAARHRAQADALFKR